MNGYNGEPILKQAINNRRLIKFDSANTTCEGYQDISNYKIDESDPQTDLNVNTGKDLYNVLVDSVECFEYFEYKVQLEWNEWVVAHKSFLAVKGIKTYWQIVLSLKS